MTVAILANTPFAVTNFRLGLVRAVRAAGHRVIIGVPEGPGTAPLHAEGFEVVDVPDLRRAGGSPLDDLRLLRFYRRFYRREGVAVVLSFTSKPVIFGTLAAVGTSVRTICTLTGLGYAYIRGGWLRRVMDRLYGLALRRASFVLFHNPDDRQLFLRRGLVDERRSAVVGGSGVDTERFTVTPIVRQPFNFLFVGRLLVDKGVREFVGAARLLQGGLPDAVFTVVGAADSGNPAGLSTAEVRQLAQQVNVRYLGSVADVRPALLAATVVVLPSYREGLPRVLLEAAATGRPLIATDVPGCRELARPGETGWLVPVRDKYALAEAMRTAAAAKPAELNRLGRNARRMVEAEYREEAVIAAYLRLL